MSDFFKEPLDTRELGNDACRN